MCSMNYVLRWTGAVEDQCNDEGWGVISDSAFSFGSSVLELSTCGAELLAALCTVERTVSTTGSVNTYTISRLRVNYLCIFLLIAVDKLVFYMYVFLIYVCLQKHCLRLICLSSITLTYLINISDVNAIGPSYRVS